MGLRVGMELKCSNLLYMKKIKTDFSRFWAVKNVCCNHWVITGKAHIISKLVEKNTKCEKKIQIIQVKPHRGRGRKRNTEQVGQVKAKSKTLNMHPHKSQVLIMINAPMFSVKKKK